MATFTLDDIRSAADAKYGSTDIEFGPGDTLSLVNPLRLPKHKRETLQSIQDDAAERDSADVMRDAIRLVASNDNQAERFLALVGDDAAVLATVFSKYTEGAQVGEASASQD